MDAQPSGRRKIWCQETLGHLSQGTGWYLASWSCLCSAVLGHGDTIQWYPVPWLRWPNVSWHQVFHLPEPIMNLIMMHLSWICGGSVVNLSGTCPRCQQLFPVWRIKSMKIMKIDLKWVHMARYGLILRLDGALWLTIISKPPLTPKGATKIQNWQKN